MTLRTCLLVLSCPRLHMHYQLLQANSQLATETGYVLYHERLSAVASHTLLSILRKSLTVLIANFLTGLCTNRITVYIIFSLPKPLYTALTASAKDNIPTNSLTSNSHSTKTVLSIDVYLNLDDCYFLHSRCFMCCYVLLCLMLSFFYFFYPFIVTVCACHTALQGYLLTYLLTCWLLRVMTVNMC